MSQWVTHGTCRIILNITDLLNHERIFQKPSASLERGFLSESSMILYILDIENNPTCLKEKDGDLLGHEGLNISDPP